jgi:hypothetical protein|tara:strand:- start:316 stop:444 length:129 start_codon:yes stop_codon:yes gene_type:complete
LLGEIKSLLFKIAAVIYIVFNKNSGEECIVTAKKLESKDESI